MDKNINSPLEIPIILNTYDAVFLCSYFAGYGIYEERLLASGMTKEDKLNADKNFRRIYRALPLKTRAELAGELEELKNNPDSRKDKIDEYIQLLKENRDDF